MSAYSVLEPTLQEILRVIKPLQEDWATRLKIIDDLREVVQSVESLRGATVEPFGSFVSNLFTRWGDLDISIIVLNGSHISFAGKKRKQNLLREVRIALRRRGGWNGLQLIPNARVPILKFESKHKSVSCDVSIDNLQGQIKSKFLFWINEIDGRFRDMVLLVKEWANAHDINNPKAGTFNSYSLSLLVIFHFQTCVPAILPPLKDIYPGNVVDDLTGVRANAERHIGEISATNIARFRSDKFRRVNRSSLPELFISFLTKFSDLSFRASELGICPFTGKWENIGNNMRWLPKTSAIIIEDPFEQPENAARTVSARQLTKISEAIESTRLRLMSANQNQSYLLATLVRPQTSLLIARTPVRYPIYNGGHLTTRPQLNRAVHSPSPSQPSQVQHQFQRLRLESRPNSSATQRPVQQYHSQGPQMWRPKSDR